MLTYFLVLAGSAAGGVLRYIASGYILDRFDSQFPWGTLLVNISGCAVIGGFLAFTSGGPVPIEASPWHVFVTFGLLGGYTTYSSFSLEAVNLVRDGELRSAAGYVAASFGMCAAAAGAAFLLMSLAR